MDQQQSLEAYFNLLDSSPTFEIQTSFSKGYSVIGFGHDNVCVSISGGADSDVLLDFTIRLLKVLRYLGLGPAEVKYVFFDTGLEFQATKEHLTFLEKKYDIVIHREKAVVPVPLGVRLHGAPFLTKQISDYIDRLQRHGFKWEDRPFDELYKEYPRCKAALKWWCNEWGEKSRFNIERHAWLKEFMVANPPGFKISKKCCEGAKKKTAKQFQEKSDADLTMQGLRRAENGTRSTGLSSCFTQKMGEADSYRPLFWFTDFDKQEYCEAYGVTHSRCYTEYGLPRTGCACCPFGSNFENELLAAEQYEPKLHKAALKVFGDSYEYTRAYRQFKEQMTSKK